MEDQGAAISATYYATVWLYEMLFRQTNVLRETKGEKTRTSLIRPFHWKRICNGASKNGGVGCGTNKIRIVICI